jgi:hypothetical protein
MESQELTAEAAGIVIEMLSLGGHSVLQGETENLPEQETFDGVSLGVCDPITS